MLLFLTLLLPARADTHVLPSLRESAPELQRRWTPATDGWWVSPVRTFDGGPRAGALVEVDEARDVAVQVRVRGAHGWGPWLPLVETWRGDEARVLVADLDDAATQAQARVRGTPDALWWELRTPVDEPRQPAALPDDRPPAVSAALAELGVTSRETWGSRSTTCTTTEDDWYRMAIHHTAGSQTYGGTVQGAVQALQSYAMDSGGYCDIPYQFVVGYDGSLWEGRNLAYYSGATGGGNNDGNIAVSFLGCYTGSGCPGSSHEATDAMLAWARALVWTLAEEHDFWPDSSTLMGHRDYPGNSTVCPGDYVQARLDELTHSGGYYAGTVVDAAVPVGGTIELSEGTTTEMWVELRNDGMRSWSTGSTKLAPLPRDEAHPLAAGSWLSDTRVSSVSSDTGPGATGRFALPLHGAAPGTYSLDLALVEEGVTWFSDLPWGGSPAEGALSWTVVVTAGGGDGGSGDSGAPADDTGGTDGGGSDGGPDDEARPPLAPGTPPGAAVPLAELGGGCGCAAGGGAAGVALLPLVLGLLSRRRS